MTNKTCYNRLKIEGEFTLEVCNEASRIMNGDKVGEYSMYFSPAEAEAFLTALYNLGHFSPPVWGEPDDKWKAEYVEIECDCGYKPSLVSGFNGLDAIFSFRNKKGDFVERCPSCMRHTSDWASKLNADKFMGGVFTGDI